MWNKLLAVIEVTQSSFVTLEAITLLSLGVLLLVSCNCRKRMVLKFFCLYTVCLVVDWWFWNTFGVAILINITLFFHEMCFTHILTVKCDCFIGNNCTFRTSCLESQTLKLDTSCKIHVFSQYMHFVVYL